MQNEAVRPDLVIEGGVVLTMVPGEPPLQGARIAVKDGVIAEIATEKAETPVEAAVAIDARDAIVMPGLINAHTHAAMTLFRGFADDLPLKTWLFQKIFPLEAEFLNPETVYWGAALGCLEMIASGTTSFVDGYFFQEGAMRAAHQAGMRGLIAQGVIDFPAPGVEDPSENLSVARAFIEKWRGFSPLLRPGLFCHSPGACSPETLRKGWEMSKEFDLPLQIHLSETEGEVNEITLQRGKRPVHYLDELGVVDDRLIAAHAVHLQESEMLLLSERRAKIVHAPESNMKLASGAAPAARLLGLGLSVGLGTDGCASNNNLDLFQEMDTAAKLSKVVNMDPVALTAEEALRMATAHGAAVMGLEREIGTLERGKRADIIVIDLNAPHLCPLYDPFSALVYSAGGADVRDVVVDGRVLMRNRAFLTLDRSEILARVRETAKSIFLRR